jgi:hypothetical protein
MTNGEAREVVVKVLISDTLFLNNFYCFMH